MVKSGKNRRFSPLIEQSISTKFSAYMYTPDINFQTVFKFS